MVLCAGAACSSAATAVQPAPAAVDPQPAPALSRVEAQHIQPHFPGVTPVLLATVEPPATPAVVVWPLPVAGGLLTDARVFLVRRQTNAGAPGQDGEDAWLGPFEMSYWGLDRALGPNAGAHLSRPCGLPREQLSAHVAYWMDEAGKLVDPVGGGRWTVAHPGRLGEAYRALSMAFSAEAAVLDNVLLDLVFRHARGMLFTVDAVEGNLARITIMTEQGLQRARLPLERCNNGYVLAHPQHALVAR